MSALLFYCERCGSVGFHTEACIAATSAERIAAMGPQYEIVRSHNEGGQLVVDEVRLFGVAFVRKVQP